MSTEARLDFEHNASWDPIHDGAILSMCICPDGRYLASGGADGRLIVWDTSSGEPLHRIDANSPILCMTWMELSGDDTKLFCGLQSGTLLEASVAEGQTANSVLISGYEGVLQSLIALAASRSLYEKRLALGDSSEVKIWKMVERMGWATEIKIYPHLNAHNGGTSLTLTCLNWFHEPDSTHLAIAYKEEGIFVYDLKTQNYTQRISINSCGPFDISNDNNWLAVCILGKPISVYNCRTALSVCELEYVERCTEFVPVLFSFDDAVLCAGTSKGHVRMWAIERLDAGMPPRFNYFMKCPHGDFTLSAEDINEQSPIGAMCCLLQEKDGKSRLSVYFASRVQERPNPISVCWAEGVHHQIPQRNS